MPTLLAFVATVLLIAPAPSPLDVLSSTGRITALGGERYSGRIIDRSEGEAVIARPGGDLLVVPVQRVLPPLAGAGVGEQAQSR